MTVAVVGVHGIGNRRFGVSEREAADLVARTWRAGLDVGLDRSSEVSLTVAYYAEQLQPEIAQGPVLLEELSPGEAATAMAWAAELGVVETEGQGRMTAPVRQAFDWIAQRHGLDAALVRRFVARFCREVELYLEGPADRRRAARQVVLDEIVHTGTRVVVAHSLGSVVAYEALWQADAPDIDLLVTLGSPLAMPSVVLGRLDPRPVDGRGCRPPSVRRWANLADRGDLVAVPRWLGRTFEGVDADEETSIATFDFHRVHRYLACSQVAREIRAQLT